MMANIAVTLAPLSLGLGSFEATCTATHAMLGVRVKRWRQRCCCVR
jgi:hypothetical protein